VGRSRRTQPSSGAASGRQREGAGSGPRHPYGYPQDKSRQA
jgi:hypothetical protein